MSDVILTNWTVYYDETAGDNVGYKQLRWTGTTGTNTLNELYTELMHFFNDPENQTLNDDFNNTVPLNAVTPTNYEIGKFDFGDNIPWFIDPESIKHLTGGGLQSVGWTRVTGSDPGIIRFDYSLIREKGSLISGGFKAPGNEGLKSLLEVNLKTSRVLTVNF